MTSSESEQTQRSPQDLQTASHAVHETLRLLFFTELDGAGLLELLQKPQVLEILSQQRMGIAMALYDFTPERIAAVRLLNTHNIYLVAWLALTPSEGLWYNLQNYPQAVEHFRTFRAWADEHKLRFQAIGLDIEPPLDMLTSDENRSLTKLFRILWNARENVLYPAAYAAYSDLVTEAHQANYEVHAYQLPILADDRRVGTSFLQRALDVVEIPADLEIFSCYSSAPVERFDNDLGGALIASYGDDADGVAVGTIQSASVQQGDETLPPLSWPALKRDLLLAARNLDTIYISSLEGVVERGWLARIAVIDWNEPARALLPQRIAVALVRTLLFAILVFMRFGRGMLAWSGWLVALLFFIHHMRVRWRQRRSQAASDDQSSPFE